MFEYCIVKPLFTAAGVDNVLNTSAFFLLAFSSVCIAAGGYVINDYFDLNIDLVNKPKRDRKSVV